MNNEEKILSVLEEVKTRLDKIEFDLAEVKEDLAEVKEDLAEVKEDLAEVKEYGRATGAAIDQIVDWIEKVSPLKGNIPAWAEMESA